VVRSLEDVFMSVFQMALSKYSSTVSSSSPSFPYGKKLHLSKSRAKHLLTCCMVMSSLRLLRSSTLASLRRQHISTEDIKGPSRRLEPWGRDGLLAMHAAGVFPSDWRRRRCTVIASVTLYNDDNDDVLFTFLFITVYKLSLFPPLTLLAPHSFCFPPLFS